MNYPFKHKQGEKKWQGNYTNILQQQEKEENNARDTEPKIK